ncbi:MAG: Mur ligase domain-containing protein, partial [Lutispora sp.]
MFLSDSIKTIHFVGIGGISMSGLAEIMLSRGYSIQGSDMQDSPIIRKLKSHGINIKISHYADNVHGADLVVYTSAVKDDNPEIL